MNGLKKWALFGVLGCIAPLIPLSVGNAIASSSAAPTITGFAPARGLVGATVTIYGHNLAGVQAVQINGVPAENASANSAGTRIVVTVPPEVNVGPGSITVTTPEGTATTGKKFMVLTAGGSTASPPNASVAKPSIRSIAPSHGAPGTKVIVTGSNLRGALWVKFNGKKAVYLVPSAGRIVATVPEGAHSGPISVATKLGDRDLQIIQRSVAGGVRSRVHVPWEPHSGGSAALVVGDADLIATRC